MRYPEPGNATRAAEREARGARLVRAGFLAALSLVLVAGSAQPPAASSSNAADDVAGIAVHNGGAAQRALVAWAIQRFVGQGLPVPPVTDVVFPPSPGCVNGAHGFAHHQGTTGHIEICVPNEEFATAVGLPLAARRTILHELGHLWTERHVDAATRQAFMRMRGLTAWRDRTHWECSGSEHAAEVLMWGLLEETLLTGVACESWREAFRVLTGTTPLDRSCLSS